MSLVLATSAWLLLATARPAAEPPAVMPLEEVRAGQRGTGLTVFEGTVPGPFDLEVLGVQRGGIGAGRDLIIVRLLGERLAHTGVVAGMSGSPVTIGGRLVGALAFRIGAFTKEPIAGVTPFAYMQEIPAASPEVSAAALIPPGGILSRSLAAAASMVPPPLPEGSMSGAAMPMTDPLLVAGADPGLLRLLDPPLRSARWALYAGGSAPPGGERRALVPGDAVGALLMDGDLQIAATGTVTAVLGDRVLAFGHPFLRSGSTRLPMTRVDVITTVASDLNSYKLGNIGQIVGTFDQDRLTGIAGTLGQGPELIPVRVTVRPGGREPRTRQFYIIDHPAWSPFLAQAAVLTSMLAEIALGEDVTLSQTATWDLGGLGRVELHEAYAQIGAADSPVLAAAGDVGRLTAFLLANRFQRLQPRSLDVTVDLDDARRYWIVRDARASERRVRPGAAVMITAVLETYRDGQEIVRLPLRLPLDLPPGPLEIVVGGAEALDRLEERTSAARIRQLRDVRGLRAWIAGLRSSDRLHVLARRPAPGAVVDGYLLPDLPSSVLRVLSDDVSGVAPIGRATVAVESRHLDGVVIGGRTIDLEVLPGSPAGDPN